MENIFKKFKFFSILIFSSFALMVSAQKVEVSGVVYNKANNETLPGVTILERGTSNGTITDFDGSYTLSVSADAILEFSYIGFKKIQYDVSNGVKHDVYLEEENQLLEEVIVIGYGVQKKSDKTGAVSHVKSEELNAGRLDDPIQALQGKAAGVNISKKGGDPNAGFSVNIRGASSFTAGTQPLFVVDGVPGVDPTTIAAEDIESFNVLKDASSTAIYGSS